MHNFYLSQLPLTLVPVVQFETNMFQEVVEVGEGVAKLWLLWEP